MAPSFSLPGDDDDCSPSSTSKATQTRASHRGPPSNSGGARVGSSAQEALLLSCSSQPTAVPPPAAAPTPSSTSKVMPAGPSCRGSPSDSVGTHVRTSSQALRPAAPSSLLHFLLGLCMERVQRLHPPGAAPFVPNDSQSLACYFSPHEACGVCVLRREDSTSQGGRGPSSKFAACYHSAEQRRQQILLALPLMAVIRKISRVWSLLGCGAAISYIITASSRGASIFRILSNRHVEGGFSTRLCSHVLSLLGYKGRSFARLAEFIDLVSTFFRHAGSSLKSASDILSKVNEYQGSNSVRPRISHESASSSTDSNEVACLETIGTVINNRDSHGGHPGVQQKVISTMGEGNKVISQWKEEGSQISVDVPPNMSVKSALELKKQFEREDADRLLQGATIKSILDKASAKSDLDATQRDEELQGRPCPSSSSGGNKGPGEPFHYPNHRAMAKTNGEIRRKRLLQIQKLNCELLGPSHFSCC